MCDSKQELLCFAKNVSLASDRKGELKGSNKDDKSSACSVGEFFHELQ